MLNSVRGLHGVSVDKAFPDMAARSSTNNAVSTIGVVEPVIGTDLINAINSDEFAVDVAEAKFRRV